MESQEQIMENLNHEKVALDQMVVNSMKEIFGLKKELLIKDTAINNLNQQIQTLLKEKATLQESMQALQSEAQSGG